MTTNRTPTGTVVAAMLLMLLTAGIGFVAGAIAGRMECYPCASVKSWP